MAALVALKSTTAEDALLELVEQIAGLQTDTTKNPQKKTVITTYTRDGLTGAMNITIALPVSSSADATTGLPNLNAASVFL
jgi:hypothetical protein